MKRFPKTLVITLTAVILSLFVSCAVFAGSFVEWELTPDGQTLTGDGNSYEFYGSSEDLETGRVIDTYAYANNVTFNGSAYSVYSYEKGGEIIRLKSYSDGTRIYVTKEGKKILDGFFSGKDVRYKLWDGLTNKASNFDDTILAKLMTDYATGENLTNISVQSLKSSYNCQDVTMHDSIYFFTYTIGAFYTDRYTGEMYYVDYLSLGNQHFDANGNFSYRSGNVDMVKLDNETVKSVTEALQNSEQIYSGWEWEDRGIYYSEEEALSLTPLFYAGLIILGFVFPLPFLVCGLIFPRIKKFGKPKYWYIMSASSFAWILASTVFTIIVLMAQ